MEESMQIGAYQLLSPFEMKDGGNCEWTFANKGGKTYFIKKISDPVYPTASMSEKNRKRKQKICEDFKERSERLFQAIRDASKGNSIAPIDFFVYDGRFYIVTEKVDAAISFEELSQKSEEQKMIIMKVLAYEMGALSAKKIVHSDLKPGNLLIKKRLMDFIR